MGEDGRGQPAWRLRGFRREDQDAARRLILSGLGEHFGTIDERMNPDLDDLHARYIAAGHRFVVAEARGEIVGTGGLRLLEEGWAQVVRVSVHPAWRRQHMAAGLVEWLIARAPAGDVRWLLVETNDDWHAAIALYRSLGFQEFRRADGCVFLRRPRNP